MQHKRVCIFIVTDELTTPLEDFVFTSSLTSPKPVKRAKVRIYVLGLVVRYKQPPLLWGAKNTHLYKILLSRFQLPYPLLKMSFADFPRSAYAGGTAILPVKHVNRTETWARISFIILFSNSVGKLILLPNMALKLFKAWSWYKGHMLCNCFPKSFVRLKQTIKLFLYTLTIVQ